MGDDTVARILALPPFSDMDPAHFPEPVSLAAIIRNDTRLLRFEPGDFVVRAGDYRNSAFLVLTGTLRVVLPPGLPRKMLGRGSEQRRGLWDALSQLWRNPRLPEVRDPGRYLATNELGTRPGDVERVFLQDVPAIVDRYQTETMGAGTVFGEIAALGRTQSVASVFAESDVEVLEIRWQGLREMRRRDEAFRLHVEQLYRERSLSTHLRETPLFRHLPPKTIDEIAACTLFETYGEFDWYGSYKRLASEPPDLRMKREPVIVAEGDYADGLLLIRSGFGRVSRRFNHGQRTLRYLGRGGVFGLAEILGGAQDGRPATLNSSLSAVGYTDVLRVPTSIIEQHVLPSLDQDTLNDAERTLTSVGTQLGGTPGGSQDIAAGEAGEAGLDSALMEMLLDRHLINGTAAMLIDLDRCVRCDDCVEACATAHGNNPRFVRHGPRYGPLQVANACMHCADPVCMIGCPTGAIHRSADGGQVLINDATCIGCSTCANACPYDNIRMVEIRDEAGQFIVDASEGAPILKATKCDLCIDQPAGPACERACPHDALTRLDLRDLPRLSQWLNR